MDIIEYTVQEHAKTFGGFRSEDEKTEVINYIQQHEIPVNDVTDALVITLCAEYREKRYAQLMSIPRVREEVRYLKSKGFTYEDFQKAENRRF